MAFKVEGVVNGGMHADEALSGSSRFKPLHLVLSSPYPRSTLGQQRLKEPYRRGTRTRVFSSKLREHCAVNILLGLAIAEGRLSALSLIAAITVISSIAAVPVMFTGFGRRTIAVPAPPSSSSDFSYRLGI
jgi:hypothetical protein